MTLKDGTVVPVDSVVTVEDIPASRSTFSNENSYKVTLSATASNDKIVTDSGEKNGDVTASATLELIWTDGSGLKNVIKQVSGTLKVIEGKVRYATLRYGNGWSPSSLWTEKNVTGKSSFSYSPNKTLECPKADYTISFEEAFVALYLKVSSNIMQ